MKFTTTTAIGLRVIPGEKPATRTEPPKDDLRELTIRLVAGAFERARDKGHEEAERVVRTAGAGMGAAIKRAFGERDRRFFAAIFTGALKSAAE